MHSCNYIFFFCEHNLQPYMYVIWCMRYCYGIDKDIFLYDLSHISLSAHFSKQFKMSFLTTKCLMNSSFDILEQSSWIKRQGVVIFYHVMAINTNCFIVNYCTICIPICWTFDNPCYCVDKCVICTYKLFFIFDNWMFLLQTCFFLT